MFYLFSYLSYSVPIYTLAAAELIIDGDGEINSGGVNSKGSVSSVTKVTINNGPTAVSDKAFESCIKLESISFPKSITKIGQPFYNNGFLKIITVDPQNTFFCSENNILYSNSKKLLIHAPCTINIEIPEGVTHIQNYAFLANHFNYGTVVLPSSISTLNTHSFWDSVFDSLSFKSTSSVVTMMGFGWARITTITIPNSVTLIDDSAFYSAVIANIRFERDSKLRAVGKNSFDFLRCPEISFPDSLQSIGANAFRTSEIRKISIGSLCSSIDISAFAGCAYLSEFTVSESNTHYISDFGTIMNKGKTQIIFVPVNITKLTIPGNVNSITKTALQSSSLLTSISFSGTSNAWSAENGVLYSKDFTKVIAVCGGKTDVTVNSNVQIIGDYATFGCLKLKTFKFSSNKITTFQDYAFSKSGLQSFDLPNSVNNIGKHVFEQSKNLTTFTMKADSPMTSIPYYCFYGDSGLESFTLGNNVNTITEGGFYWCLNLTTFTFLSGSKISTIGSYAFEHSGITSIKIPSTVTSLSERCFRFCINLETVHFNSECKLTTIPYVAFFGDIKLTEVTLSDYCTTLEDSAFGNCTLLSIFRHKVTNIGSIAFEDCSSLKTFDFSATQTKVNPGIFKNCYSLKLFTVNSNNKQLKEIDGCVYNIDGTILYLFPPGQEMAKIQAETVSFADNAFAWSPKLTLVAFYSDSNLETIGMTAFFECRQLTTVQFPAKLQTIKTKAFFGCTSLKSILLPPTLSRVETAAFMECSSLKSVKYCGTKAVVGEKVFEDFSIVSVTDLYPTDTFCSSPVFRKLSVDCEFKEIGCPTCATNRRFFSFRLLFYSIFLISC